MNIISKLTNPPPAPASGGHYAEASFVIATIGGNLIQLNVGRIRRMRRLLENGLFGEQSLREIASVVTLLAKTIVTQSRKLGKSLCRVKTYPS